jgi:bacterioferritin (cytochrome b1)
MITSKSTVVDKIQDLLALEIAASEIYKKVLKDPASKKYQETLSTIMNDELSHIELVKGMLKLVDH